MPTNLINLCTKGTMSFSLCLLACRKSNIRFLCFVRQHAFNRICFLQIHKFREHVSRNLYKGKKKCVRKTRFFFEIREREAVRKTKFFSTASGMSFSLCLLGLCNFCLADNHTDQRIKFIIVRGRLSGGSMPALSITLSIHAILRPSFSMTSTPSISCTASPLSAPCTAFQ